MGVPSVRPAPVTGFGATFSVRQRCLGHCWPLSDELVGVTRSPGRPLFVGDSGDVCIVFRQGFNLNDCWMRGDVKVGERKIVDNNRLSASAVGSR